MRVKYCGFKGSDANYSVIPPDDQTFNHFASNWSITVRGYNGNDISPIAFSRFEDESVSPGDLLTVSCLSDEGCKFETWMYCEVDRFGFQGVGTTKSSKDSWVLLTLNKAKDSSPPDYDVCGSSLPSSQTCRFNFGDMDASLTKGDTCP